jgi:hypothetical protein
MSNELFGSSGKSKSQEGSSSGWALLPPEIQTAYINYANQISGQLANNGSALSLTPAEQSGINTLSAGTAPTASSIKSDIDMQANPYNDKVIEAIKRQFSGEGSQLTQAANNAGGLGSNRYQLGANDISNTQAQTVGSFLNNQFNTQMNNALTTLPQARANSALQQLQAGSYGRLAPISGLQQYGTALGILPTSGGSLASGSSSSSQGSGFGMFF